MPFDFNSYLNKSLFPILFLDKLNLKKQINLIDFFFKTKINVFIVIKHNSFNFNELFFLKNVISNFYDQGISIGILGIPYCVLQNILGGFEYLIYEPFLLKMNYFYFLKKDFDNNSILLLNCKNCVAVSGCLGLGILSENSNNWSFRLDSRTRMSKKKEIIFDDKRVNQKHLDFINYILTRSQKYTDRTIKYAKVFTKKKDLEYVDRFVYFCRYLKSDEIETEKKFFLNTIENKSFGNLIFDELYKNFLLKGFAYTFCSLPNSNFRETFYLYFKNQELFYWFLNFFNSKFKLEDFESFYDISFDFFNFEQRDTKIYTFITDVQSFFTYLKNNFNFTFDSDIIDISYNFFFVRRMDINGNLKSVKFEFNTKDFEFVKNKLNKIYNLNIQKDPNLIEEIISPDITINGEINKITIYYGNFN